MSSSSNQVDGLDHVGFDPTTDTYYNRHDWDDPASLSFTIVETVAAVTGRESTDLSPLYSALDPDALEAIMAPRRADSVRLTFTYEACIVTVASSGEVVVDPVV